MADANDPTPPNEMGQPVEPPADRTAGTPAEAQHPISPSDVAPPPTAVSQSEMTDSPAGASAAKELDSSEIEALLGKAAGRSTASATARPPQADLAAEASMAPGDVDYLFNQAEQALASITAPSSSSGQPPVMPFKLQDFSGAPASTEAATLELIRDVELDVKIELGRTNMYLEDVLKLRRGSVVPLDKLAGDPVDIFVNGRLIARGEVLVLNDNFCVRVAELIAGENVPG